MRSTVGWVLKAIVLESWERGLLSLQRNYLWGVGYVEPDLYYVDSGTCMVKSGKCICSYVLHITCLYILRCPYTFIESTK